MCTLVIMLLNDSVEHRELVGVKTILAHSAALCSLCPYPCIQITHLSQIISYAVHDVHACVVGSFP
jgi:hypothetical protein